MSIPMCEVSACIYQHQVIAAVRSDFSSGPPYTSVQFRTHPYKLNIQHLVGWQEQFKGGSSQIERA